MKLISREFSIQKLYIGPIPSIPVIQCTKLTASSPVPTPSLIFLTIPLRECTGMFVVLALQLYIYVSFHYRFLTATLITNSKAKLQWMYINLSSFLLVYIYLNTSTSPPSIKSSP